MTIAAPHPIAGFLRHPSLHGIIAAENADVLPRLPPWAIAEALRRLPVEDIDFSLQNKVLAVVSGPGANLYAGFGGAACDLARRHGLRLVAQADPAEFLRAAGQVLGRRLIGVATYGLAGCQKEFSARRRLTAIQWAYAILGTAGLAAGCLFLPLPTLWVLASFAGGLFFLAIIALRILCLLPPESFATASSRPLTDRQLPVYSVLVPLFRETAVLDQLLEALLRLKYPASRLDIKLILEEGDLAMRRAVSGVALPDHFDVIVVPSGRPQTKARALNYALHFARGSLLTIFDAEDIPEPRQLRHAAESFAARPDKVACLQAELCFYNPNENWLTRQFTIEYATLFGLLLPALASYGLPLPLGGTSNHFRTSVLCRVGAWDPYNVTEDADLGLRLARYGYSIETFRSRTYEEANVRLGNWLRQRSRWLKGFLQTWLVHMRQPVVCAAELGATGFWTFQAVTAGVVASALLHPVCIALTLWLMATGRAMPGDAGLVPVMLAGLSLAVFVSGYGVALIAGRRALRRLGIGGWWLSLATMPVYWLLISVAAWLAVWEFIARPFHWNKTQHGLSRLKPREAA